MFGGGFVTKGVRGAISVKLWHCGRTDCEVLLAGTASARSGAWWEVGDVSADSGWLVYGTTGDFQRAEGGGKASRCLGRPGSKMGSLGPRPYLLDLHI